MPHPRAASVALLLIALVCVHAGQAAAEPKNVGDPSMLSGDTPATGGGWNSEALLTVGDEIHGHRFLGKPDGAGALRLKADTVRVLVNHELRDWLGEPYALANGTVLTGARISYFDLARGSRHIRGAGIAYDAIRDRRGDLVTHPSQVSERDSETAGIDRLCSAVAVEAGTAGFVDDIFFSGEEVSSGFGGTEYALDVRERTLWACPALGRAAFENVAPLDTRETEHVALLIGNDAVSMPLGLYVGEKDALGDGSFLDRNGLASGRLFCWASDEGDASPEDFHGSGATRAGRFLELPVRDPASAGAPGHDAEGYLNARTLRDRADAIGCFSFSRPEDLHASPSDGTRVMLASTGNSAFPSDLWGTLTLVDVDLSELAAPTATLTILHDADGLPDPDQGIRNPDNLTWADNGLVIVQEDASTGAFGASSGIEASVWSLDPDSGELRRIAEIDRSVVLPADAEDERSDRFGAWESSGVIDVTELFSKRGGTESLLLATVQAHGVVGGSVGGDEELVEGGQLVWLSRKRKAD